MIKLGSITAKGLIAVGLLMFVAGLAILFAAISGADMTGFRSSPAQISDRIDNGLLMFIAGVTLGILVEIAKGVRKELPKG